MKYRVKSPLDHNNKPYPVGSTVELSEEEAAQVRDAVDPIDEVDEKSSTRGKK